MQDARKQQRVQAEATQKEKQSMALLKAEEEAKINEHIRHQNALAQSNRSSRRHGAGCAGLAAATSQGGRGQVESADPGGLDEDAEPSKAQSVSDSAPAVQQQPKRRRRKPRSWPGSSSFAKRQQPFQKGSSRWSRRRQSHLKSPGPSLRERRSGTMWPRSYWSACGAPS